MDLATTERWNVKSGDVGQPRLTSARSVVNYRFHRAPAVSDRYAEAAAAHALRWRSCSLDWAESPARCLRGVATQPVFASPTGADRATVTGGEPVARARQTAPPTVAARLSVGLLQAAKRSRWLSRRVRNAQSATRCRRRSRATEAIPALSPRLATTLTRLSATSIQAAISTSSAGTGMPETVRVTNVNWCLVGSGPARKRP
jgi:hypothetical protein